MKFWFKKDKWKIAYQQMTKAFQLMEKACNDWKKAYSELRKTHKNLIDKSYSIQNDMIEQISFLKTINRNQDITILTQRKKIQDLEK